jgi:hypothetical protein
MRDQRCSGDLIPPAWLPRAGSWELFNDDELVVLEQIVKKRDDVNASNTRGGGTNLEFHRKGVFGEAVVRKLAGLPVDSVPALDTWDSGPDLEMDGVMVEIKAGVPVEAKTKVRDGAWYVVVGLGPDRHGRHSVTAVCCSDSIWDDQAAELDAIEKRPDSRGTNYLIPFGDCKCVSNAARSDSA